MNINLDENLLFWSRYGDPEAHYQFNVWIFFLILSPDANLF
jgi:hypothetical protein